MKLSKQIPLFSAAPGYTNLIVGLLLAGALAGCGSVSSQPTQPSGGGMSIKELGVCEVLPARWAEVESMYSIWDEKRLEYQSAPYTGISEDDALEPQYSAIRLAITSMISGELPAIVSNPNVDAASNSQLQNLIVSANDAYRESLIQKLGENTSIRFRGIYLRMAQNATALISTYCK